MRLFFSASLVAVISWLCVVRSQAEVLVGFDAKAAGSGTTPDLVDPPWESKGRPMVNSGEFLLQDTTSEFPLTAYGNYVSPQLAGAFKARSGEYGIEFKVRPLDDLKNVSVSYFANLMVAWGDEERSYRVSIDKASRDDEANAGGGLTGKGNYMEKIVDGIDWTEPHTIFIGYRGAHDEFDFYVDGELRQTVSATQIGDDVEPSFTEKVSFGDFTSGQTEPYNTDVRAEWYSVKVHDGAKPPSAEENTTREAPTTKVDRAIKGTKLPVFSSLPATKQLAIRTEVAPPPLAKRMNPYSTPMYYPMWRVEDNLGNVMAGSSPDGMFHPEWQEALVRDWAELGMTRLHLSFAPQGNGTATRSYEISDLDKAGMTTIAQLAKKYGMKVGLRLDLPMGGDGYWLSHPNNPANELSQYAKWIDQILNIFGDSADYIILGDEIDTTGMARNDGRDWKVEHYGKLVKTLAEPIHARHPKIKVSTPAYGSGSWSSVMELVDSGFAEYGNAVAINLEDMAVVTRYAEELRKDHKAKGLTFLSNGVGYVSGDMKSRNPTSDKNYYEYTDSDQAGLVARAMYLCWDAKLGVAPYYIVVRNIEYKGKVKPMWYGFFGFSDLVIDQQDRASVRHYPGWWAYQTIASTFYDIEAFRDPSFTVSSSSKKTSYIKAHERKDGQELLIVLWGVTGLTDVVIDSEKYAYPVKVDLLNGDKWEDLRAVRDGKQVVLVDVEMKGTRTPVILRLVAREQGA